MKWQCKKARRFAVLAAYHDLTARQEMWLAAHSARCTECSVFRNEIHSTLASIPRLANHHVGESFLESLWPRIATGLYRKPANTIEWWRTQLGQFLYGRKIGYTVAFAAVMVLVGVLIGRYFTPVSDDERHIEERRLAQITAEIQLMDQIHRTREYLDRTRTLLLGILNREPVSTRLDFSDLKKEQEVSRRLVNEGRQLHSELTGDDQGLQRLLIEEIEALLLQLANLEEYHAAAGIEKIQNGAEQRGILLKIAIEDMKIAEQAQKASAGEHVF